MTSDKYKDTRTRCSAAYNRRAYEQVAIRVKKGCRDRWKAAADEAGESLAGFISDAVEKKIEKIQKKG